MLSPFLIGGTAAAHTALVCTGDLSMPAVVLLALNAPIGPLPLIGPSSPQRARRLR
jgi:hypothetical protein